METNKYRNEKDFWNMCGEIYNTDIDVESINEVLNELGIRSSNNNEYRLILWNDHVNDMMTVIISLYEVCKLNESEATKVMLEAHEKGKSVIKTGPFEEMNKMKIGLNDRNIEATIE